MAKANPNIKSNLSGNQPIVKTKTNTAMVVINASKVTSKIRKATVEAMAVGKITFRFLLRKKL